MSRLCIAKCSGVKCQNHLEETAVNLLFVRPPARIRPAGRNAEVGAATGFIRSNPLVFFGDFFRGFLVSILRRDTWLRPGRFICHWGCFMLFGLIIASDDEQTCCRDECENLFHAIRSFNFQQAQQGRTLKKGSATC